MELILINMTEEQVQLRWHNNSSIYTPLSPFSISIVHISLRNANLLMTQAKKNIDLTSHQVTLFPKENAFFEK
jgi:hypothetical protein